MDRVDRHYLQDYLELNEKAMKELVELNAKARQEGVTPQLIREHFIADAKIIESVKDAWYGSSWDC